MQRRFYRSIVRSGAFAACLAACVGITTAASGAAPAAAALPGCNYLDHVFAEGPIVFVPAATDGVTDYNCYLYRKAGVQYGVAQLQRSLNICYGYNLAADGVFGPQTESALKHVQSIEGIPADGVMGTQTKWSIKWKTYWGNEGSPTKDPCWERW